MALAEIIERILSDASEEAARVRAEAEVEARAIREAAEREVEERAAEIRRRAEEELLGEKRNRLAVVRLEERKKILALKHRLLEEVFTEAAGSLSTRPAGEYAAFLAGLVPAAVTGEAGQVAVGRADLERYGPGFTDLVRAALAARYPEWSFSVRLEPAPFPSGLSVSAASAVFNLALEALLAERRERWELEVGKALFAP